MNILEKYSEGIKKAFIDNIKASNVSSYEEFNQKQCLIAHKLYKKILEIDADKDKSIRFNFVNNTITIITSDDQHSDIRDLLNEINIFKEIYEFNDNNSKFNIFYTELNKLCFTYGIFKGIVIETYGSDVNKKEYKLTLYIYDNYLNSIISQIEKDSKLDEYIKEV